ncbi:Y-family DNA polymerase [Sulfurimonas marina]|uniref:DNA polymerase IV n=1 Tax=Sulfurimonas marina TaxID=2590551 RepID=A0A7M1B022_9BACT|nr:DNA polymerase IV [Sulfurimonas marina]QOP41982.1 DNA polymerase IV [Sulfurimonas marina]
MKIHIDIDCFFVSALRTIDPSLEHKAVAIGGRSDTKIFDQSAKNQTVNFDNSGSFVPTFFKAYEEKDDDLDSFRDSDGKIRGILTTSSYEARAYGVKTAMRIEDALQLCPHLIIKAPNMSLYQELSNKLHEYLNLKIPLIEQASIDEFYGDLDGWIEDEDIPQFIDNLRHEIKKDIKLPVSIGAAKTRYIAKTATTYAKPFGSKTIYPWDFDQFVNPIKVEDFAGVGRSMREKLHGVQIHTLGELRARRGTLESWGPYAKELYRRVNGESDAPIQTKRERKSIGISRTIEPLFDREELRRRIHILARHLSFAIMKLNVIPTVFHLSIAYELNKKTRASLSMAEVFTDKKFDRICVELFNEADTQKRLRVIRLSIQAGSFTKHSKKELSLLSFYDDQKMEQLTKHSQILREKYGLDAIKLGSEM